ncbi:MAG: hypothetical protein JRE71_20020, partial [Deltaproteobacteria bacterium]|nr:hypothetical protein [Deltaproteobacteria bacterium]
MESKFCLRGAFVAACVTLVSFAGTVQADSITLTAISTPFPRPIGIDHFEPLNQVVMSVNYSSGSPNNFVLVEADGTQSAFSALSGFTNE